MKEKARKAQGIRPPVELVQLVAAEYLKVADTTKSEIMLSFSSWMGKLIMDIQKQFCDATNVVSDINKWGGLCFRHDAITICALRAKGELK